MKILNSIFYRINDLGKYLYYTNHGTIDASTAHGPPVAIAHNIVTRHHL